MQTKSSVSLKTLSAIKIGGTAEKVFFPETISEFIKLLKKYSQAPIIGQGTNIFFADKKFPVVICTKKLKKIENKNNLIVAECGALLEKLFSFAAGVPATIGGGVTMNFGAFGFEIKDFLKAVEIFDPKKGSVIIEKKKLRFSYRNSSLKKKKQIILRAFFTEKYLERKKEFLVKRKKKMPWDKPNIGSIFLNPQNKSAGVLIEAAGLKGLIVGDAQVSHKHSNIFVNKGKAKAEDLLEMISTVKAKVAQDYGIKLQTEVVYIE